MVVDFDKSETSRLVSLELHFTELELLAGNGNCTDIFLQKCCHCSYFRDQITVEYYYYNTKYSNI